jgi:UrcA family protein
MKTALSSLAIAALLALGATAPARADEVEFFRIKFKYDQAELATADGQQKLLSRLQSSIRKECTPQGRLSGAATISGSKVCIDRTMKSAITKMGSAPLAALYQSRTAG